MLKRMIPTTAALLLAGLTLLWPLSLRAQQSPAPLFRVTEQLDVKVPMRDGVRLSANIYRPDTSGAFPALLLRTPYGNGGAGHGEGHFFAGRGYAVVLMDTRGRYESEGVFDPMQNEAVDGVDTQQWLARQGWCNGRIGTFGGSYVGYTQWMPAAAADPHLVTMFPVVTFADLHDMVYYGGAFRMSLWTAWSFEMSRPYGFDSQRTDEQLMKIYTSLPLVDQDRLAGWQISFLRDWLGHPERDKYWERTSIADGYSRVRASSFNVGGWFDICLHGTLENFKAMTAPGIDPAVRAGQRLLIGPWVHSRSRDGKTGELDFSPASVIDLRQIELQWFDHQLKGLEPAGLDTLGPVRLFVMGANTWRNEREWPLARTEYRDFFLAGDGRANTRQSDGSLRATAPASDKPDSFVYDPRDPVLSAMEGPYDEADKELRGDILVYSSAPLEHDLEVTGPVRAVLWAASTATNTDFTVKLLDVYPDGRAMSLCDGIVRAAFREPGKSPSPIEPGKIYEYEIDLWATSNVFLKGHRLRVEISSSNFPRFDRNLNTGENFATGARIEKATQTVHHSARYPSRIVLPVIP